MLHLERVDPGDVPDRSGRPEHTVFQTSAWLDFIAEAQRAEPLIAAVQDGSTTVGWFTGGIVRRGGVRILGSPFRGWSTSYLGFDLDPDVPRVEAATALAEFAFGPARCLHVELLDRWLDQEEVTAAGYRADPDDALTGWELDLSRGIDELFAGLSTSGRWGVRKAGRNAVVVSRAPLATATDQAAFAAAYHRQLTEVFERRSLKVPYPEERVRCLLHHVGPTGSIVALKAMGADGSCVATGLFPFDGRAAYFWGGASTEQGRRALANDVLLWQALVAARSEGCQAFDFGGGGTFKAKFGGTPVTVPWARRSRWRAVDRARQGAARATGITRRSGWPRPRRSSQG